VRLARTMVTVDRSIVIPTMQAENAMRGACRHIEAVRGAARWLWENGYQVTSTYFSILCMEEIKYHVISSCKLEGRGVTKEDLESTDTHEKKIAKFLEFVLPPTRGVGGTSGAGLPTPGKVASMLARVKERAAYFEFAGDRSGPGEPAGPRLHEEGGVAPVVSCRAWRPDDAAVAGRAGRNGSGSAGGRAGKHGRSDVHLGRTGGSGRADPVPRFPMGCSTPPCLVSDHLAMLCRIAHGLLAKRHVAASVLVGVIAPEGSHRHYMLAKYRRGGKRVEAKNLCGMANHKARLLAFSVDAAKVREKASARDGEGERTVLDPKSLVRLNAVRELAIYFVYLGDEEVTLEEIFGCSARNLAIHVGWIAQGLVSCMLISDEGASDPRVRNDQNDVHYERRKQFKEFVRDSENVEQIAGWHKMAGMLKELNDAARNLDVGWGMQVQACGD